MNKTSIVLAVILAFMLGQSLGSSCWFRLSTSKGELTAWLGNDYECHKGFEPLTKHEHD